jgi:protein involved in polysaccharide export with SLBB domain
MRIFQTINNRLAGNRRTIAMAAVISIAVSLSGHPSTAAAQSSTRLLASRAELTQVASQSETAALKGDPSKRAESATIAAAVRQRLRDGDFRVGDRIVVTIISDAVHRDTVVVRADHSIELLGNISVPLSGVLRSELQDRVSVAVLKYVKAQLVETTPLLRIGVLGAVTRPGYFAFSSDVPLSDVIMSAGGPTGTADIAKSTVRRGNQQLRSPSETSNAIANGTTLDQLGLVAGDELVIGQHSERGVSMLLGMTGALASVLTLVVALNRH